MSPAEILAAMQREAVNASVAQYKYESTMSLYRAACMEGDGVAADAARAQMHAIMDVLLDSSACIVMLSRQMLERR